MPPNEFGDSLARIPRRICGLLTARGRSAEWEKAFEHIALHFKNDLGKKAHTRFRKKYCNEAAVKELILRAANAPSSVKITKLTIAGLPLGADGIKIVRTFSEPIGDSEDLTCLLIITNAQGTLMTAYPAPIESLN
jgi:hypothetical protein